MFQLKRAQANKIIGNYKDMYKHYSDLQMHIKQFKQARRITNSHQLPFSMVINDISQKHDNDTTFVKNALNLWDKINYRMKGLHESIFIYDFSYI